jgi:hypothetical protein
VASGNTVNGQKFSVELFDAGIPVTSAGIDFEGVVIRARASGAAGNAITMAIDPGTLVYTTSNYSLLQDIEAGSGDDTSGYKGSRVRLGHENPGHRRRHSRDRASRRVRR